MIERHYNMVGRPPDMRSLEQESISSLAVLEQQSAGRRSSRVNKKTLRKARQATKNAHARSGKQIAARATKRPSYSRPETEGPAGRRSSRVINYESTTHQRRRTNLKNTREEKLQKTKSTSYVERLEVCEIVVGLKGWAPKPSRNPPASINRKNGATGWSADAAGTKGAWA